MKSLIINKKYFIFTLVLTFFLFLPLYSNIKGALYNCFHAYDFGIYQQAFFNMASGDLNPFISVRGLNFFNDHFMPITFLSIPFVWIFNYHISSIVFIEWFSYFLLILGIILSLKKNSQSEIFLALFFAIFSKGILSAVEFPVHPGVWAMPVWLLLVKSIYSNNTRKIFFYSVLVCLFRESYPFSIFMLSIFYFLVKQRKLSLSLLIFSVSYLVFIMKVRPILLGPAYDYGGWIVKGFLENPFSFLMKSFYTNDFLVPFKIFAPFILPVVILLKKEKKIFKSKFIPCLFLIAPQLAIHLLTGKFHFHYGPPFMVILISYLIFNNNYAEVLKNKKRLYLIIFIFIITASSRYTKFVKFSFASKSNSCVVSDQKDKAIGNLLQEFKTIKNSEVIVSTGGVIQRVMRPGIQIYPPNTMVSLPETADYLLFEKDSNGDTYPWSKEQVNRAIENCRKEIGDIIIDDKYFFLMKGKFSRECYNVY